MRYFMILFGTFSVGTRFILSTINGPTPIHPLRFYTIQTNVMILAWTLFAVLWKNKEKYSKLTGFIKGGLTGYITITMIVFYVLIEPSYDPVGLDWWTSLFNHYINPTLFILDFFLTEKEPYEWKWLIKWLIYPYIYLAFGLIWGGLYGEYLYSFIDLPTLGWSGLAIWVGILNILFLFFSAVYVSLNKIVLSKNNS